MEKDSTNVRLRARWYSIWTVEGFRTLDMKVYSPDVVHNPDDTDLVENLKYNSAGTNCWVLEKEEMSLHSYLQSSLSKLSSCQSVLEAFYFIFYFLFFLYFFIFISLLFGRIWPLFVVVACTRSSLGDSLKTKS